MKSRLIQEQNKLDALRMQIILSIRCHLNLHSRTEEYILFVLYRNTIQLF